MAAVSSAARRIPNREAALKSLYDDVATEEHVSVLGDVGGCRSRRDQAADGDVPGDSIRLALCRRIEPILHRAAELVTMDDCERRSLILVNPGLAPKRASVNTMYTAYRLNDAERDHAAAQALAECCSLRLNRAGNFTGVEGENMVFGPGDMVLTPNDAWHNHGTVGNEPALNLSVLDLPLVETLNAVALRPRLQGDGSTARKSRRKRRPRAFQADYSQRIYGEGGLMPRFASNKRGGGTSSPMFVYRWEKMRELLDVTRTGTAIRMRESVVEYIDPTTGGPVFRRSLFSRRCCAPANEPCRVRETASLLFAPFAARAIRSSTASASTGTSSTRIAVPGGSWVEHVNGSSSEPVFLFVATDEPTLEEAVLYKQLGSQPGRRSASHRLDRHSGASPAACGGSD